MLCNDYLVFIIYYCDFISLLRCHMLVSIEIYFVLCFCKVSCLSRAWLLCCVTCGTAYFTHMHSCCIRGMHVSLCLNSPCTWRSFFTFSAHYHIFHPLSWFLPFLSYQWTGAMMSTVNEHKRYALMQHTHTHTHTHTLPTHVCMCVREWKSRSKRSAQYECAAKCDHVSHAGSESTTGSSNLSR